MPNYVYNNLTVIGSEERILKYKSEIAGDNGVVDFDKVLPYPQRFKEQDDRAHDFYRLRSILEELLPDKIQYLTDNGLTCPLDGFNLGGCEWREENWGTKWNACTPKIVDEGAIDENLIFIEYYFETAWWHPEGVFLELGRKYPDLLFNIESWSFESAYEAVYEIFNGKLTHLSRDLCCEISDDGELLSDAKLLPHITLPRTRDWISVDLDTGEVQLLLKAVNK